MHFPIYAPTHVHTHTSTDSTGFTFPPWECSPPAQHAGCRSFLSKDPLSCFRMVLLEGQAPRFRTASLPGWPPRQSFSLGLRRSCLHSLPARPGRPGRAARRPAAPHLTLVSCAIFLHIFTCMSGSESILQPAPPWASALEPWQVPGACILLLSVEAIAKTRPALKGSRSYSLSPRCARARARGRVSVWAFSGGLALQSRRSHRRVVPASPGGRLPATCSHTLRPPALSLALRAPALCGEAPRTGTCR